MLVCFCHFANPLVANNPLAPIFQWFKIYGVHGVQIFFVISGFVIPLSMDKAQYSIKHYFKFIAKRAVRLHPPYLVALALTLVIIFLANKVKHIPYPETIISTLKSCFYLHEPQHIPVFWTLKIEAEYYIFMGLYFVLLKNFPKLTMCLSYPLFMFLSQTQLPDYIGLFEHLVFFLIGATGYLIYMKQAPGILEWASLAALSIFTFVYYPFGGALAALFTVLFILFFRGEISPFFNYMGEVSYSIYLIHYPIGVKIHQCGDDAYQPKLLVGLVFRHPGICNFDLPGILEIC
ncbi:acyltransferase [Mucilaginibacter sp. PAMB04168]|uniref:acyltransferase family protein n=1 Tax=Mucilaginibacter sp. PAMB04168 TaxID=3138567 RepID=UPI0031F60779